MDYLKAALPPELLAKLPADIWRDSSTTSPLTDADRAASYNQEVGHLEGMDCPVCRNKGQVAIVGEDGTLRLRECSCMARRRSLRHIERSGLKELLGRYAFDSWQTPEPWQTKLLAAAKEYAAAPAGWFFVSGRPGTGKTHICTAVCGALLESGLEVRYLLWRDFAVRAKAMLPDAEDYLALLGPLKRVSVLYIDDFLKVQRGQRPTVGDVNLAFELLNARYNDSALVTIISSELSLSSLLEVDEALGSRIIERAKGNRFELIGAQNWRLHQ